MRGLAEDETFSGSHELLYVRRCMGRAEKCRSLDSSDIWVLH